MAQSRGKRSKTAYKIEIKALKIMLSLLFTLDHLHPSPINKKEHNPSSHTQNNQDTGNNKDHNQPR